MFPSRYCATWEKIKAYILRHIVILCCPWLLWRKWSTEFVPDCQCWLLLVIFTPQRKVRLKKLVKLIRDRKDISKYDGTDAQSVIDLRSKGRKCRMQPKKNRALFFKLFKLKNETKLIFFENVRSLWECSHDIILLFFLPLTSLGARDSTIKRPSK